MIAAGTYRARATDTQFGFTQGGKEEVAIRFQIETGERITWWGYFSEKAFPVTMRALSACGFQGDDLDDLSTVGDLEVELVVTAEEDERTGKMRSRVRWVNRLSSANVELRNPMTTDQKRAFAERLRARVQEHLVDRGNGSTGQRTNDDAPF